MSNVIFLLTSGDGSDGDEWNVISIHSNYELAEGAKTRYEAPRTRSDGSTYCFWAQIEEWPVDKAPTPDKIP